MEKKLGIVILKNQIHELETYGVFLLQEIANLVDQIVIAGSKELLDKEQEILCGLKSMQIVIPVDHESKVKYVLNHLDNEMLSYDTIVLADDTVFGPFYSLGSIFTEMEMSKYDGWGILKHAQIAETEPFFDSCFFVLHQRLLNSINLWEALGASDMLDANVLQVNGFSIGAYFDTSVYDYPKGTNNQNYAYYYGYDMVKVHMFPFIKCDAFKFVDGLDYSHREDLRKAFDFINSNLEYDVNLIWDYILKYYNIADIKECLHLYYIVESDRVEQKEQFPEKKIAVLAHLFYGDLLDETLAYLKEVPEKIDIYITTHGVKQINYICQVLRACGRENYKVIEAGERGRDAASLLVVCRKYIEKYDYICFVHDKKTSGGRGPRMVGDTFRDTVFENTIPNAAFIENVVGILEQNPRLGFLSPICPVFMGYQGFYGGFGNEWTSCYEKTKELAERLNISAPMSEKKQPIALSNTFWCKVDALKSLFGIEWKIEDFDPEPLAEDGTLNHAIERIYPYVAQDAGYYSGLLLEKNFASSYINNLKYSLAGLLNLIRSNLDFKISRDVETAVKRISQEHAQWLQDADEKNLLMVENAKKEAYIQELTLKAGSADMLLEENAKKEMYIEKIKVEIETIKDEKEFEMGQKRLYMEENEKKEKYIDELTQMLACERQKNDELKDKVEQASEVISEKNDRKCVLYALVTMKRERIYIYGAGKLAQKVVEILEEFDVLFEGFIVTEKHEQEYLNHKVFTLDEIETEKENCGILVALNEKNCQEVVPILKEQQYSFYSPWYQTKLVMR